VKKTLEGDREKHVLGVRYQARQQGLGILMQTYLAFTALEVVAKEPWSVKGERGGPKLPLRKNVGGFRVQLEHTWREKKHRRLGGRNKHKRYEKTPIGGVHKMSQGTWRNRDAEEAVHRRPAEEDVRMAMHEIRSDDGASLVSACVKERKKNGKYLAIRVSTSERRNV